MAAERRLRPAPLCSRSIKNDAADTQYDRDSAEHAWRGADLHLGPPLSDFDDSIGLGLNPDTVLADGTHIADIISANLRRRRLHQVMSRVGLALIFAGFAAQLVAVWL